MPESPAPPPVALSAAPAPDVVPEWAVLVVHGVGETEAGQTLGAVVDNLAAQYKTLDMPNRYEMIPCPEDGGNFPVFIRRGKGANGAATVFAEVYWADLSQIRDGAAQLIVGLFRMIFGLRHVADQAAAQPCRQAAVLRPLLLLAALLLRGPIFALTVFSTSTGLLFWLFPGLDARRDAGADLAGWGLLWATLGAYLCLGWARHRVFGISLTLAGLAVMALAWGLLGAPDNRVLAWLDQQTREEYRLTFGSWAWCLASVVLWNDWLFEAAIWVMLGSLLPLAHAWIFAARPFKRALTAAYLALALLVGMWVLAVSATDLIILPTLTLDADAATKAAYYLDWTNYVAGQLVLGIIVGLAAGITWCWRLLWASRHPKPPADFTGRPPRLIVALGVEVLLFLSSIVMGLFTVFLAHQSSFEWPAWFFGRDILFWSFILFVLGMIFVVAAVRNALHIVMDIVNHFIHKSGDRNAFPIRKKIHDRFRLVLGELLRSHRPTNLAIISHSQGTIIAVDVLSQPKWAAELDTLKRVVLLTFGSPLTHVYQHYFPSQYPALSDPGWQHMLTSVDSWVNVFRWDDFVGTHIDPEGGKPVNMPVGYGGHTNYWASKQVLDIIAKQLPELVGPGT